MTAPGPHIQATIEWSPFGRCWSVHIWDDAGNEADYSLDTKDEPTAWATANEKFMAEFYPL